MTRCIILDTIYRVSNLKFSLSQGSVKQSATTYLYIVVKLD